MLDEYPDGISSMEIPKHIIYNIFIYTQQSPSYYANEFSSHRNRPTKIKMQNIIVYKFEDMKGNSNKFKWFTVKTQMTRNEYEWKCSSFLWKNTLHIECWMVRNWILKREVGCSNRSGLYIILCVSIKLEIDIRLIFVCSSCRCLRTWLIFILWTQWLQISMEYWINFIADNIQIPIRSFWKWFDVIY